MGVEYFHHRKNGIKSPAEFFYETHSYMHSLELPRTMLHAKCTKVERTAFIRRADERESGADGPAEKKRVLLPRWFLIR